MIKIKKGNHSLLVSKKTFETMYQPIGYIVEEEAPKKASSENEVENVSNQLEDKNAETLLSSEGNLALEEKKSVKKVSRKKEEDKKEISKENSLESILGMLSQKETTKR